MSTTNRVAGETLPPKKSSGKKKPRVRVITQQIDGARIRVSISQSKKGGKTNGIIQAVTPILFTANGKDRNGEGHTDTADDIASRIVQKLEERFRQSQASQIHTGQTLEIGPTTQAVQGRVVGVSVRTRDICVLDSDIRPHQIIVAWKPTHDNYLAQLLDSEGGEIFSESVTDRKLYLDLKDLSQYAGTTVYFAVFAHNPLTGVTEECALAATPFVVPHDTASASAFTVEDDDGFDPAVQPVAPKAGKGTWITIAIAVMMVLISAVALWAARAYPPRF